MLMTMLKAFSIAFLLFASQSALAAWEVIHGDDATTIYADLSTIRRAGNTAKMWHLTDYKSAQVPYGGTRYMYSSSKFYNEYGCKDRRVRVLSFSWYSANMGEGKVVYGTSKPGQWEPVMSETVRQELWQLACGNR